MFLRTTIMVLTLAIAGVSSSPAQAGYDWDKTWVGHHLIALKDWAGGLTADQKLETHRYLNYEHRQPCQNYRPVPEGLIRDNCTLHKAGSKAAQKQPETKPDIGKVFKTYTVFFDFDSSSLNSSANKVISKVANEINRFSPKQVTVAGHTDRSGPSGYNLALSQRRAETVSNALSNQGVNSRVIQKSALGDTKPAVKTEDGVREAKNRRVVVEFRR